MYERCGLTKTNFIRVKLISVMVRFRSGTGLRKVREFCRGLFKSSDKMCWVVHKENICSADPRP